MNKKYIDYDFSNFERIMSLIKQSRSGKYLNELKEELNKFFKDSRCNIVLYTENYDKLFFGMCVIPNLNSDIINSILKDQNPICNRVSSYILEIDSKLLDLGLTAKELVAVLLHEVGHLVNNSEPLREVQNYYNMYMTKNNLTINFTYLNKHSELFEYAIQDAIRNITSLFKKTNEEIIADEFSIYCGYGKELESAYKKIISKAITINSSVPNKLVTLQWVLRIYNQLGIQRLYAIKTLNKCIQLSGSKIEKDRMSRLALSLNKIKPNHMIEESVNLFKKTNEIYKNVLQKDIKRLEDDLYEFNLRVKNVDEHEEALTLMRQINSRLNILEDHVSSGNLNPNEKERWYDLINKYRTLREELSKKTTYDDKYYGLFVQLPNIKSRYEI